MGERGKGGWAGGGGADGGTGWEAGAGLNLPLGPFGLAMGPRSASHRPKTCLNGVRDVSPPLG